jgi:hypothetical protein
VQKDVTVVKLDLFIPPFGTKKNHRFYPDSPAIESGSPNGGISGGRVWKMRAGRADDLARIRRRHIRFEQKRELIDDIETFTLTRTGAS